MRVTCDVTVFGEGLSLPLTMEAAQALEDQGLCAVRLSIIAASKGEPFVLGVAQAARVIAVGYILTGKDRRPVTLVARDIWARARKQGTGQVLLINAATEWLASMAAETVVEGGETAPKAGGDPSPN